MKFEWTIVCLISVIKLSNAADPRVNCTTGTYIGSEVTADNGIKYNSFRGIKFANVFKRFEEAVPVELNSNSVFNASAFCPVCVQRGMPGIEDCLCLNVYTPDTKGNFSVIFFIHGGGYVLGGTNLYDPDYFMETGRVVVVTVAYRLGVFGFLYLDDTNYPANLGIRDQIHGLKWVRDNVKQFGGDPNRITLVGQSAGAASVHIIMHSPLAQGMFVGAISESGTTCGSWALQPRCLGLYKMKELAMQAGCGQYLPSAQENWNATSLVKCLRLLSDEELLNASLSLPLWDRFVPFNPIVESSSNPNAVITVFPWLNTTSTTNLVPWISGTNSDEAATLIQQYYPNNVVIELAFALNLDIAVLSHLLYYTYTAENSTITSVEVKKKYYNTNGSIFLTNTFSDDFFYFSNYQCMITSLSPSYGYYFNYSPQDLAGLGTGVGHNGELKYFWKDSDSIRTNGKQSDAEMSVNLVNTWINFTENQVPTFLNVTWNRYNGMTDNLLIIDDNGARMGPNPKSTNNMFWQNLGANLHPKIVNCDLM